MAMIIDGVDFQELESEKYWSFPKSYKKDANTETYQMIMSGEYMGSRKMDGAYYRFIKDMDGNMRLQGRSRSVSKEFLDKIGHVPHLQKFFDWLPKGTCLLGELYFPNNEGSSNVTTIMGCKQDKAVARQSTGDKLHYYVFDVWAFMGKSYLEKKAVDRFTVLNCIKKDYEHNIESHPEDKVLEVDFAVYYSGQQLWDELRYVLDEGGEGIVITRMTSTPEPGKRTARKTLKVKKEIKNTLDVVVLNKVAPTREYTGKSLMTWKYWENTITGEKVNECKYDEYFDGGPWDPVTKNYFYDWAGSLQVGALRGDKFVEVGRISGLSEDVLAHWRDYIGQVMEISCMEIFYDTKGLRHPKFVQWRPDKAPTDCKWEDIYG